MKILICSLLRDSAGILNSWRQNLSYILDGSEEHEFYLSIFENDSGDDTKNLISSADYSSFKEVKISLNNFGHQKFGCVSCEERVKNLAFYRNKSLRLYDYALDFDYFLFLESDIKIDKDTFKKLLKSAIEHDSDIISPLSWQVSLNHFYDAWGTRFRPGDHGLISFDFLPQNGEIKKAQSTFNCFCLYKPYIEEPFGWFSEEFQTFDCDTSVICEKYRKMGKDKIFVDSNLKIFHP